MDKRTAALKAATACKVVAKDVKERRLPLTRIGRESVFGPSGGPCCPLGYVLQRAGLRNACRPFKGDPFPEGAAVMSGALRWDNTATYAMALGLELEAVTTEIDTALEALQIVNGTKIGDARRGGVVAALHALAAAIEEAA